MNTVDKLEAILATLRDEYLQHHTKPWIIGFSGGKDSTLLLQLVLDMMLDLRPSQRKRAVHVVSNDTLVESPIVQAFVDTVLVRIRDASTALKLPVTVAKTVPAPTQTFWVNLIGRGYPAPTGQFRWCTDRLKIQPTSRYIKDHVEAAGEVILLVGVRRSESAARAKSVAKHGDERLNPHGNLSGCWVFRPIVELSTEEVWQTLLQRRPAWGGTHRPLVTLYRNAQAGECPFVVDADDAPSCGENPSSRFGCWMCTVVEKDRSMEGMVASVAEHLAPLIELRDWVKRVSYDPSLRLGERRNGQEGLGPLSIATRASILERLLAVQVEVGTQLISPAEIDVIRAQWSQDESDIAKRSIGALLAIVQDGEA